VGILREASTTGILMLEFAGVECSVAEAFAATGTIK